MHDTIFIDQTVEDHLKKFKTIIPKTRKIEYLVIHNTLEPTIKDWHEDHGAENILSYWYANTPSDWEKRLGTQYIISPPGKVYRIGALDTWTNGNSTSASNRNGIGFELVGDFRKGYEQPTPAQLHTIFGLVGGFMHYLHLSVDTIHYHGEFNKSKALTCPGDDFISKEDFKKRALAGEAWVVQQYPNH